MFCTKCGNPSVNTKFCPKCGAPVRQAPPPPASAAPFSTPLPGMDAIARDAAARRIGADKQHTPPGDEPKSKGKPVFTEYETGATGFFGTIYHFVFDMPKFFMRADMEREAGKATMVLIMVNVCVGLGQWGTAVMMGQKAKLQPDKILIGSIIALLYPFVLSLFGMVVMSMIYRAHANWKRIYCIYAFSSIPYLLCLIPFCGMRMISFLVFCICARTGFENVFGLEPGPAWLFALGLPVLLVISLVAVLSAFAIGVPQLLR
jgi:hypothetical protein